MALFRKKNPGDDPIAAMRREIGELRERLDAADRIKADLLAKIDTVDQTNAVLYQRVDSLDATSAELDQRVGTVGNQVQHVNARVDDVGTRVGAMSNHVQQVNDRVEQVTFRVAEVGNDVVEMHRHVDGVNQQVDAIGRDVGEMQSLAGEVGRLAQRLETPPPAVPPPPPVSDPRIDDIVERLAELDDVGQQITRLTAAVADRANAVVNERPMQATDAGEFADLSNRLEDLGAAIAEQRTELDASRVDTSRIAALHAQFTSLTEQIEDLGRRLDEQSAGTDQPPPDPTAANDLQVMRTQMAQMAERMAALDGRMTNVSVELAHQLTELSNDLELLIEREPIDAAQQEEMRQQISAQLDQALGDVRTSTERLAAEQARYQISFRQDLAEIVERFRRTQRS